MTAPTAHLEMQSLALNRKMCCCRYPKDAWEVLLGYVQERMMGERAGAALLEDIKAVDAQAEQ